MRPLYIVIYDISEDDVRSKVATTLQRYGMSRVQKSAFAGELSDKALYKLTRKLWEIAKKAKEGVNIQIIQVPRRNFENRIVISSDTREEEEYLV